MRKNFNETVFSFTRALEYEDVLHARRRNESRARNGGRDLPYDSYQTWEAVSTYIVMAFPCSSSLQGPARRGYNYPEKKVYYWVHELFSQFGTKYIMYL